MVDHGRLWGDRKRPVVVDLWLSRFELSESTLGLTRGEHMHQNTKRSRASQATRQKKGDGTFQLQPLNLESQSMSVKTDRRPKGFRNV